MAQKVTGFIASDSCKATPAPPVGPASASTVNIMAFTKEFNERKNDIGMIIPVVITVYADRSFTFVTRLRPPPF